MSDRDEPGQYQEEFRELEDEHIQCMEKYWKDLGPKMEHLGQGEYSLGRLCFLTGLDDEKGLEKVLETLDEITGEPENLDADNEFGYVEKRVNEWYLDIRNSEEVKPQEEISESQDKVSYSDPTKLLEEDSEDDGREVEWIGGRNYIKNL